MSELPSGTLTVLHTDIESSTRLTAHLGERYPEVLAAHCRLLRGAFAANEGREVDTQGDSFFVVFPPAPRRRSPQPSQASALSQPSAGRRAGLCACALVCTRGNRSGRRRGTQGWTSSGPLASRRRPTITGFDLISTDILNFDRADIGFTGGNLIIVIGGQDGNQPQWQPGHSAAFQISTSVGAKIPLPATLLLLAAALAALALIRRRAAA